MFKKRTYFKKLHLELHLPKMFKKDQEKNESSAKSTDNVVAHAGVLKGTLLQTAKGKVVGINTDKTWTTSQILFDTGSRRTYLTENLHKHLNRRQYELRMTL